MPYPELTPQQEYVWSWINSINNAEFTAFKKDNKLEDLTPAEWWAKIDEIAAENSAKGIKLPEMTLDLTNGTRGGGLGVGGWGCRAKRVGVGERRGERGYGARRVLFL